MPTLNITLFTTTTTTTTTTTVQAAVVLGMLSDPVATPPIPIESAFPAMTYAASSIGSTPRANRPTNNNT